MQPILELRWRPSLKVRNIIAPSLPSIHITAVPCPQNILPIPIDDKFKQSMLQICVPRWRPKHKISSNITVAPRLENKGMKVAPSHHSSSLVPSTGDKFKQSMLQIFEPRWRLRHNASSVVVVVTCRHPFPKTHITTIAAIMPKSLYSRLGTTEMAINIQRRTVLIFGHSRQAAYLLLTISFLATMVTTTTVPLAVAEEEATVVGLEAWGWQSNGRKIPSLRLNCSTGPTLKRRWV